MKIFLKKFIPIIILISLFFVNQSMAANSSDLQKQIDAQKQKLNELIQQQQFYNSQLEQTQSTKKTLNSELNQIQQNLDNINFKIKINEVQIEKLNLELEQLQMDISNTSEEIEIKRQILAKNLQELYERNKDLSPLIIVLKNQKISDVISEINNVQQISESLKISLDELNNLKNVLSDRKTETELKKQELQETKIQLSNQKSIALNLQNEKSTLLSKTKNQEKNYQTLLSNLEKQRVQIESEIYRLEEALKAQINPSQLPGAQPGVLLWPIRNAYVTQGYGETSDAQKFYSSGNYKSPSHNGIDIRASVGTPIYAAEDGKVVAAGNQDNYCYKGSYGRFIVIEHNNNLTTLYGHLSLISVNVGETVKRGQIIGYSGNSGFTTGPHLHFTVYYSPTFRMSKSNYCGPMPIGASVNPMLYL
ncbi:MAG TPA: peptidoglycan DD-metalloendopeptidase family protein [Candidatus Paceibacterota bacterium]|nr:peptidoglycan DD-metalloendopeptidase family protein [Parcubacteria group bacterium]HOM33086.1 peptidoglycan DD-metalloendopeptidase family protein [Candidatus Paceibacterota bacterium]HPC37505.1 peptidoglycan DD-metalloendopeptidase family protein [Candidatus Paceibacterota bacterium]